MVTKTLKKYIKKTTIHIDTILFQKHYVKTNKLKIFFYLGNKQKYNQGSKY